jgi:hypothetical protein
MTLERDRLLPSYSAHTAAAKEVLMIQEIRR